MQNINLDKETKDSLIAQGLTPPLTACPTSKTMSKEYYKGRRIWILGVCMFLNVFLMAVIFVLSDAGSSPYNWVKNPLGIPYEIRRIVHIVSMIMVPISFTVSIILMVWATLLSSRLGTQDKICLHERDDNEFYEGHSFEGNSFGRAEADETYNGPSYGSNH